MRLMKFLVAVLMAITILVSYEMLGPIRTYYMLWHHRDGTTTVFESVGPYWPE